MEIQILWKNFFFFSFQTLHFDGLLLGHLSQDWRKFVRGPLNPMVVVWSNGHGNMVARVKLAKWNCQIIGSILKV